MIKSPSDLPEPQKSNTKKFIYFETMYSNKANPSILDPELQCKYKTQGLYLTIKLLLVLEIFDYVKSFYFI